MAERLFVIGGKDAGLIIEYTKTVEILDLKTQKLHTGPKISSHRSDLGAAVIDGLIYAVAGQRTKYIYNAATKAATPMTSASVKMDVYHPNTNQWSEGKPMPEGRTRAGVAAFQGKLFVVGGSKYSNVHEPDAVYLYEPSTDAWFLLQQRLQCKEPSWRCVVATIPQGQDQGIYAVTGKFNNCVERMNPAGDMNWHPMPGLPADFGRLCMTSVENRIYAMSGADQSAVMLDPRDPHWMPIESLNIKRENAAAAAANGFVYVVGGKGANKDRLKSIERFDPRANRWQVLDVQLDKGRSGPAAVCI